MYIRITSVFILLFICISSARSTQWKQLKTVKGKIQIEDPEHSTKKSLPFASVSILKMPDSTLIKEVTSDKYGYFQLYFPTKLNTSYLLKVSYTGMQSYYYKINNGTTINNLGNIILKGTNIVLEGIFITAKLPGIQIKGDTTVINASAYKTPMDFYLQDLLKKIPGMEYDEKNNKLTYNGKIIEEIKINGEAFFSGNLKITLENLPIDLIHRIKIYDKSTNYGRFTGIDDGTKHYLLDILTKTEFNNSLLSSIKTGYGSHQKKDLEGLANYFEQNGNNFSLIIRSTNKEQNSTYADNINNTMGINVTHKFNNALQLSGSIQCNRNRNGETANSDVEQYLKNNNIYSSSVVGNQSKNNSSIFAIRMLWDIDTRTQFSMSENYVSNKNKSSNHGQTNSYSQNSESGISINKIDTSFNSKINFNNSNSINKNTVQQANWEVNIIRSLNKKGTNLMLSLDNLQRWGCFNLHSNSLITYYQIQNAEGNDSTLYHNQYSVSPIKNNNWNIGLSLMQPLGKHVRVQLLYNWKNEQEDNNRNTYDLSLLLKPNSEMDQLPGNYQKGYIDSLSNTSNSKTIKHELGLRFNYSHNNKSINAGLAFAPQKRNITRKIGSSLIDKTFYSSNISPSLQINWQTKKYHLNISYNGVTIQPLLAQLIPLTDNSNPLFINKGNPNLKSSFTHNINFNINNTLGFNATISYQHTHNDFTQMITYNEKTGVRETYPININGNWNANTIIQWNKTFGKCSFNLEENSSYTNQISIINENNNSYPNKSKTSDINIDSKIRTTYRPNWGGIDVTGEYDYRCYKNLLQNICVFTRNYKLMTNLYVNLLDGMQIYTNIGYSFLNGTNLSTKENSEFLWNLGFTWHLLKKKPLEVSCYWSDILQQKKNYVRNATANSFYEYYTKQIHGYILLSLKYNFNFRLIKSKHPSA